MKTTPLQYAKTLLELADGKSEREVESAVKGLAELLRKRRQLNFSGKIIENFNQLWNAKHGVVEASITSRESLDEDVLTHVSTYVSSRYDAKEVVLREKVDPQIKGGIVIKVGDEILDASVSKKLSDLRKILTS